MMAGEGFIFEPVFGESWECLPPAMRKHYAVRAGSGDVITVEGLMRIERNWLARLLTPLLRLAGALVPYNGSDVPVTVRFTSSPGTRGFVYDRLFRFPGHAPYRFCSCIEPTGGNEVVEFMRFGFGWRARCVWDGRRVWLQHRGYVWRVFGLLIPVPVGWLIGGGDAFEEPTGDDSFRMWMDVVHPLFGRTFHYGGTFRVVEVKNQQ